MFAPKVARPRTKAVEASTRMASRHSALAAHTSQLPGTIQPKLAVGRVNDPLEHEADKVADAVTRMPTWFASPGSAPRITRKCDACEQGERHGEPRIGPLATDLVPKVLRSPGQPLDAVTRGYFEPRFGHDFARVRVHVDARAAESARAVNALAYAVGEHLVFNNGQYRPDSSDGRKLLAHELAHVVQQSAAPQQNAVVRRQGSGSGSPTASKTVFTPGVMHDHKPSGHWADVQKDPNSGFLENRVCARYSPSEVIRIAIIAEFSDKPLALRHLMWYLNAGKGADFVEDANLEALLRIDRGVQALLANKIPASAPAGGKLVGHMKIEQTDYQDQDFRYSFGAIDRLDYEVDYAAGTVHAWFQDRYEWHPVYPGLYTKSSDDVPRETNCVHAALVEEKANGARDYWMKGETTIPLAVLRGGVPPPPHPGGPGGVPAAPL